MELWLKLSLAVVLGIIAIRLWPVAKGMFKHGPRGSTDDWRAALLPLAAVIAFVVLLLMLVR
ncbi:hypothetical protein QVG61_07300 [Thiohalobacter sp. IOR34]|uniref:hypothetical protein n=1 Tax=Thiohalobacter sp. IOR34 TaxID=3057176 RepID=UPI0025AFCF9D|nr:hypothetical protein [Thiohalobacter sp. IOR34]WJW74326.1 hypothetical protein QVG61_07300 [Thiohalobacter sp. IOR34]